MNGVIDLSSQISRKQTMCSLRRDAKVLHECDGNIQMKSHIREGVRLADCPVNAIMAVYHFHNQSTDWKRSNWWKWKK